MRGAFGGGLQDANPVSLSPAHKDVTNWFEVGSEHETVCVSLPTCTDDPETHGIVKEAPSKLDGEAHLTITVS